MELSNNCDCAISVDTYKSSTAKFALDNGVDIISDRMINFSKALQLDPLSAMIIELN